MSNKQVTVGDFRQSVAENEECREIKLVSGNRKFSMSPDVFINIAAVRTTGQYEGKFYNHLQFKPVKQNENLSKRSYLVVKLVHSGLVNESVLSHKS